MPRKTAGVGGRLTPAPAASMRPRPDAAENPPSPPATARRLSASMRPRPDAAENPFATARIPDLDGALQ